MGDNLIAIQKNHRQKKQDHKGRVRRKKNLTNANTVKGIFCQNHGSKTAIHSMLGMSVEVECYQ